MKKTIYVLLLLCLSACSVGIKPSVTGVSTEHVSEEVTPATLINTVTLIPTLTSHPDLEISEYDPDNWTILFDKATVWEVDTDSNGRIWIMYGSDNVGFFDNTELVSFSSNNIGLSSGISDMAIAPDGSMWVASLDSIAHYADGRWSVTPIPYTDTSTRPRLAIDHSGVVWMSAAHCNCSNNIWSFDGKEWTQLITENGYTASRILISPDNTLWASFYSAGIGKYEQNNWIIYPVSELWQSSEYGVEIGITSDNQGNIYGISTAQTKVVEIMQDGTKKSISAEGLGFELDPTRIRIFVDSQGIIWINAYFNGDKYSNIEYYNGDHWVAITTLPFTQMMYMKEIDTGKYLVGTAQGLYEFNTMK
jgi:ligand-binding sensor domain-containing protein